MNETKTNRWQCSVQSKGTKTNAIHNCNEKTCLKMILYYRLLNVTCSFQYADKKDILIIADSPHSRCTLTSLKLKPPNQWGENPICRIFTSWRLNWPRGFKEHIQMFFWSIYVKIWLWSCRIHSKRGPSKDNPYQVWFNLVQYFQRRLKYEKLMMPDQGWHLISIACMTFAIDELTRG